MKSNLQNTSLIESRIKFSLKWILLLASMFIANNVYSQSSSTISFDDQGFAHCLEISDSQTFSAISKSFNIYAANFDGTPSVDGSLWYEDGTSGGCWTEYDTEIENGGYIVAGYATDRASQQWIDPEALVIKTTDGSEFKFTSFKAHDAEWNSWGNYLKITGYKNGSTKGSESVVLVSHVEPYYSTVTLTNSIFEDVDEVRITMDKDNNPAYGGEYTQDGLFHSFDTFVIEPASSPDTDGSVTASATVTEPVPLSSTVDTQGEAIDVFDFTITDGGGGDGLAMSVSQINVNVSGTSSDTQRGQVNWRLDGPDVANETGTYNAGTDQITFSGLSISIPDGGNETYTINAYYNNNSNLVEDNSFVLSVDGDTDFTVGDSGTQMGTTSAVTNGSGSSIDIQATRLAFTTQPAGSTSGSALTTQPVVTAQDEFGNTDVDFTETITLTEASAGTLTNSTAVATNGVATFSGLTYTATADQQSFTLTANDQDGVGTDLPTVDANEVTSDVIATKLVFTTQPSPREFINFGTPVTMTTAPVVAAVDANNVIDTSFSGSITLIEYNGVGYATLSVPSGDTDGGATSVTLPTASGQATFSGLEIGYIPNTPGATETFNLRASSSGFVAIYSDQFTSSPNTAPVVESTPADVTLDEDDFEITIPITNRTPDFGGELFSDAQEALNDLTFSASSSVPDLFVVSIENVPLLNRKVLKISLGENKNGTTTVTLRATDSGGLFAELEFDVTVNAVNDDPYMEDLPSQLTFVEDDIGRVFDISAATLFDVDAGSDVVTLKISEDVGGVFTYAAGTGISLTGNATNSITIEGTVDNINTYLDTPSNIYYKGPPNLSGSNVGTFTLLVNDNGNTGSGGGTDVEVGTIVLNLTDVNDLPVVTTTSGITAFVEDAGAVAIDDAIEVAEVDEGDEMVLATVQISGNYSQGNDVLSFVNDNATMYGSITSSFNESSGILYLSGRESVEHYQAALRSVMFNNTSNTPFAEDRTLEIIVNDGDGNSNVAYKTVSVTATNDPPVASNVTYLIGGDGSLAVGNSLSVNFDYSDPEGDSPQAYLTKWYASDDETGTNKTVIDGAESPNYFLTADVVGKYISVEVTPYDGTDYGTPVESDLDGPVYTTPTVTTSLVTSITFESATFTGEVTSDGSNSVTERGFVYSTAENPSVDDAKIADGNGTGEFSEMITDLDPNETYYVRSFATNAAGTVYGSQESFTTLKKALTVTGTFTAENKVYDGNTIATVSAEDLSLVGFVPEQTGSIQSVTYEFSQSGIGTGLTVSITELIISGADAENYTVSLDDSPSSTADITAKELTIAGSFTAQDKTYDANTNATLSLNSLTLVGVVGSESVTLGSFDADFSQSNIGTGLMVSLSNPSLTGSDVGNYTVTATGSPSTTADITAKELTIAGSFSAQDKTYDASTTATLATNSLTLDGIVGSESVTLDSFDADFSQSNIGTGLTVSVSNPTLTGSDAGNYTVIATGSPTTTADITAIELTLDGAITAENKIYDGETTATLSSNTLVLVGVLTGETVELNTYDVDFSQSNIGTGLTVSLSNPTLTGSDAGNYTVTATGSPSTTADITAKELTIAGSFTAQDKTYDASTTATLATNSLTLDGIVGSESVTLDSFDADFSQSNIGTELTVSLSNPTLTGADAGNYTVTETDSPTTKAAIIPIELTLDGTITAENKIYDGSTTATLSSNTLALVGVLTGETVELDNYDVDFSQSNIGTGLTVSLSNPTLTGSDAGNYTVTATGSPSTTADITAKELTIAGSFTAEDKTYDASTTATLATNSLTLDGIVGSESVTLDSFDADFSQSNIGTELTVSLSNPTLTGSDAGNYTVTATGSPSTTADITAKELTIAGSFTAQDKTYDASTTATLATNSLMLDGVVGSESVTLDSFDADFSQSNIGTGLTVSLSNPTLTGSDAGNYTVIATGSPTTTADITAIELTLGGAITAEDKIYDGETTATLSSNTLALVGVLTGETVTLDTYDVDFSQSNIGARLEVSLSNPTLTGSDAGNYTVTATGSPSTTADITAKELTIAGSFTTQDKTYDASTTATLATNSLTLDGVVGSESVTLDSFDADFSQSNIGTGLTVSLSNPTLTGSDAGNYTVTATGSPTTTANITPIELTLGGSIVALDKVYDGSPSASLATNTLALVGVLSGEDVDLDSYDIQFTQSNIGSGLEVFASNPTLTGSDAGNYTVTANGASSSVANITAKELTIAGSFTAQDKTYDANTTATLSSNSLTLVGVVGSESVTLGSFDADFTQSNIGSGLEVSLSNPTLTGPDAGNYTVSATGSPTTTADITAKELTITGSFSVDNKTYDGSVSATVSSDNLSLDGIVGDEVVDLDFMAEFESQNIGTNIPVSISEASIFGSDSDNYSLSLAGAPTTTASIEGKLVQISGSFEVESKVYDASNSAEIISNNLELSGVESGDDISVASFSARFESENVGDDLVVSIDDIVLSGNEVDNYILSLDDAPTTLASINPREVVLTGGSVSNKVYDGSTQAELTSGVTLDGVLDGEDLVLTDPTSVEFESESAGTNKSVVADGFELQDGVTGLASNYTLGSSSLAFTADILPKLLTVTALSGSQVFSNVPFEGGFGVEIEGFIDSEDESVLTGDLLYSGASQGAINPGVYELLVSGLQNPNYAVEFISGQLTILDLPRVVSVSPEDESLRMLPDVQILAEFNVPVTISDAQKVSILDENDVQIEGIELSINEGTSLEIGHPDLGFNTTYTVRVDSGAVVSEQLVMNSPFEWQFTTIIERPDKVVLAQPVNTDGAVDKNPEFKWFTSPRTEEYLFELASSDVFEETTLISEALTDTSFTVTENLDPLSTYFWRVTASNEGGIGEASNTWNFTTKADAPELLFPGMNQTEVSIAPLMRWDLGQAEVDVEFVLATDTTLTTIVDEVTLQASELQLSGLSANTKYFWAVRVNDDLGVSDWSEIRVFTTRPDPEEVEDEPISFTFDFGTTSESPSDPTSPRSDPQQTDYRMISLPGSDQIRLDEFFPGTYNDAWRAFIETGDPIEFYDEYSPEDNRFRFTPGLGFWVLSTEVVADVRTFTPVQTDANDAYGIPVHQGWNIIGNPFQSNVEWPLVTAFNNIDAELWTYTSTFGTTSVMEPLKAYYFYNDPTWDLDLLYLPYTGFEQRGQDKHDVLKVPESAPAAKLGIVHDQAEIGHVEWVFGSAQDLLQDSTQSAPKFRSNTIASFSKPHPTLDFAQQGAVLIDSGNDELLWSRLETTQSEYNATFELKVKAVVGQTLQLMPEFVNISNDVALLLINRVTNQTLIIDEHSTKELKVTEPMATYQVHFGRMDYLKELERELLPQEFALMQNYPNPFNPTTTIRFALPEASQVRLDVFDILGRRVHTLVNSELNAGWHTAQWNASNLASGVYMYRIQAGTYTQVIKMTLVK